MTKQFLFLEKHKEAHTQRLTLNDAIHQLSPSKEESIQLFAKVLSNCSDSSQWVSIPLENTTTNELVKFEERGRLYVGMYSDIPSMRFSAVITDINKLFHVIFTTEEISGIVIDPETTQLYLEKDFLRKCLIYCKYHKYLPNL